MKLIPESMRSWMIRATTFAWLTATMSVGTAQANTVWLFGSGLIGLIAVARPKV